MRKPMVTRTIVTTKVTALCIDINSRETYEHELVLARTYKDDEKLKKAVEKAINSDLVKAVAVLSHEEVETLYGMAEDDFIKNAVELDPTTRKALDLPTVED